MPQLAHTGGLPAWLPLWAAYDRPAERVDAALVARIAATEYQPWTGRGLVHGEVHDENAWALGGVAGHAGAFSTATDLAVFAQTLLNGGRYGSARILEPASVEELMREQDRVRITGPAGPVFDDQRPDHLVRWRGEPSAAPSEPPSPGRLGGHGLTVPATSRARRS